MRPHVPALRALVERAIDLVAPEVCCACDARVRPFTAMCAACASSVAGPAASPPDELAAFAYGGAIARAITSFKYGPRPNRARPWGHLLRRAIAPLRGDPPDLVVPVPLHRARLVERGFNQAALLASPVARDLGATFRPGALVRLRDTAAQASLERDARLTNVRGAFAVADRARATLAGARVLVVDDVRTTGATLAACASALREAGARDVVALVLAAADDPA